MRQRRTGRKRKADAERYPNGRIIHTQEAAIPAMAMERRYELVGRIEHATTIGTAPEVLEQWGMLTRRQREAAETYRLVYIAWACINGIPGRHPLSPGDEGRLRDLLVLLDPVEASDRDRRLIARKREADGLIPPGFARSLIDGRREQTSLARVAESFALVTPVNDESGARFYRPAAGSARTTSVVVSVRPSTVSFTR